MRTFTTIRELKNVVRINKKNGKSVGFVPTMGFLHEGHASLIKRSVEDNDYTVLSIFVNPTQFGPGEDFEKYPRDFEKDARLAEKLGVDVVFTPTPKEMYPDGFKTFVDVEGITDKLCGLSRSGHFRGVTTVVTKLFNIVEPDRAYFGQKDAQQAAVITQMVKDLNMGVEIIVCPIIREADGLAMSSRNTYLNTEERKAALVISSSLFAAQKLIDSGEISAPKVKSFVLNSISAEKMAEIEYVEVLDGRTLDAIELLTGRVLVAIAVKIGNTRLIDNVIVDVG